MTGTFGCFSRSAETMRVAGATQCARNNAGDKTPAQEFEQHQRFGASHHLGGQVLDGRFGQHIHQSLEQRRLRVGHPPDMGEILRSTALHHVAGDGERGAGEADQRGIRKTLGQQPGPDQAHRLHDRRDPIGDPRRVQRGDAGGVPQTGKNRALAFLEFQAVPERPGQHQDVAEQDSGVEAIAADRLERDLGREIGRGAEGDEILHAGAHGPVFRQVPSRLAHQPNRRRPDRLPVQSPQQPFHFNAHRPEMGLNQLSSSYRADGQATNACPACRWSWN